MDKNAKMWNFGEKLDLVALSKQFIVILNKVAQFWNLKFFVKKEFRVRDRDRDRDRDNLANVVGVKSNRKKKIVKLLHYKN